jgi:glycosyltransferase involved in cell wall biosynthesis
VVGFQFTLTGISKIENQQLVRRRESAAVSLSEGQLCEFVPSYDVQMKWICCQIGAREHYAVARSLNRHGALECLVTDAWVPPGSPLGTIWRRLRERFHTELAGADVSAANREIIGFELRAKIAGLDGWSGVTARNSWFQRMALSRLSRLGDAGKPRTLFAFSYGARQIFRFARARGWRTVLGQIDGGPVEERIVSQLCAENQAVRGRWERPPAEYWANWREECALADRVVVNSSWSQSLIEAENVPASKIRVVPLAYEGTLDAAEFQREYPQAFTSSRPLRVLFLGSICLRKGVRPLFDAIRLLRGEAVEFWFVGALQIPIPAELRDHPHVHWIGRVPRNETSKFYRNSDVFVFPTFSDGFGLTQLEAQAWKLPIIATKYCGDVVEHGRNGWILTEPTGATIAAAIQRCLAEPERLRELAANAVQPEKFGLTQIGGRLLHIFE